MPLQCRQIGKRRPFDDRDFVRHVGVHPIMGDRVAVSSVLRCASSAGSSPSHGLGAEDHGIRLCVRRIIHGGGGDDREAAHPLAGGAPAPSPLDPVAGTPSTAYRRFAMSLNLNTEEFESGELRFPDYGDQRYRPDTGSAIVFSSSLLHEALHVTSERPFVLLAFLF